MINVDPSKMIDNLFYLLLQAMDFIAGFIKFTYFSPDFVSASCVVNISIKNLDLLYWLYLNFILTLFETTIVGRRKSWLFEFLQQLPSASFRVPWYLSLFHWGTCKYKSFLVINIIKNASNCISCSESLISLQRKPPSHSNLQLTCTMYECVFQWKTSGK